MEKLWAGKTNAELNAYADKLNSSIGVDGRMYREDITGSIAHAKMLARTGIIMPEEADALVNGLRGILSDLDEHKLEISPESEDIHTFVEQTLTERIGDVGKKLHTARSRNDQVALDTRMYSKNEVDGLIKRLSRLCEVITDKAEKYRDLVMPGYTHLQRAQPILWSHQLMAYVQMFLRDISRLEDAKKRLSVSPIGSCAFAGTTYKTDRGYEASLLGFDSICQNSIDGVSDRDFVCEILSAISILMMHLSRFSEEIVLWSSWEFKFIELSDDFTTGSSIMPQKKNPDMAELVRGKTGRVYGDLMAILTVMKGLPLAYNKDMQEDKEALFDGFDTAKLCLDVFIGMVDCMTPIKENMLNAAKKGFINATDLADYLVRKGMPFRSAYKICGQIVALCTAKVCDLESLPIDEYKNFSELFDEDLYSEIELSNCVRQRISEGGTSPASVERQIALAREQLEDIAKGL